MAATAEKVRGGERRDVARFLAAHEHCDADFEIRRADDPVDGRLRLVCNGCGARAAYDVGEPGVLKMLEGGAPGDAPATASSRRRRRWRRNRRGRRGRPSQEQMQRWLPSPAALPWWVPNAYIFAVIVLGLAMVAFGVLRPGDDERAVLGGGGGQTSSEPAPPAGVTPPPVNQSGAQPAPPAEPAEPKARPQPRTNLRRITVLSRFRIGVPEGWSAGTSDGAVAFAAPGGGAELRVYLEPGDAGPRDLARDAARFLRDAHPGAQVTRSRAFRLAGDPAAWLEARYKGGTERAVLLSESGYEYLLLRRVDSSASGRTEAAAVAALQSFSAL